MTPTKEIMRPGFVKHHYGDGVARHFLTIPDGDSEPHDHPGAFTSVVEQGSYVEEVFAPDGTSELVHRRTGDTFEIAASHIHRIVELPEGGCVTLVQYAPHEQETRFWRWHDGRAQSRLWHEEWGA